MQPRIAVVWLSLFFRKKVARAFLNGGNLGGNLSEVCFKRCFLSIAPVLSRVIAFCSFGGSVEEPVLDPWNDS